jgi:hypothetical protein
MEGQRIFESKRGYCAFLSVGIITDKKHKVKKKEKNLMLS